MKGTGRHTAHGQNLLTPPGAAWKHFLLGVAVTVLVLVIFEGGSFVIRSRQNRGPAVLSAQDDLSELVRRAPGYFWSLQPNLNNVEFEGSPDGQLTKYRVTTNGLGLRNPAIGPKEGRYRILAIGDSTTFGQYVADGEAWPAQLQQLLDPERKRIEVINAGLIGASSFQGLSYLMTRGFDLEPDLVIVTYGFGDWSGAPMSDRERARVEGMNPISWFIRTALARRSGTSDAPPCKRATPGEYVDTLLAVKEACDAHGAALLYVVWPGRPGPVPVEQGLETYRPLIFGASRITGVPYVDLTDALTQAASPVFLDCIHVNAAGCRIVAECLAKAVRDTFVGGLAK